MNCVLAGVQYLLVMFHPRASHNSKVFPSRDKGFLDGQPLIAAVDGVFWEQKWYDCPQNDTMVEEVAMELNKV